MRANTDKIANASPSYARLLASARAAQSRRRELARFLTSKRQRCEFEQINILFQKERILLFNGDLYCHPGLENYILFSVSDLRAICDRLYEDEEEAA